MSDNVSTAIIEKTLLYANGGNVYFVFQGGEPTLASAKFYSRFCQTVQQFNTGNSTIHYSLQTNGADLPQALLNVLSANNFLVGVSLDGDKATNDCCRHYRNSHYDACVNTINKLKKHNIDFNVLTVITDSVCQNADLVYDSWISNNLTNIQLIPCMQRGGDCRCCPTTNQLAQFYKTIAFRWLNELDSGTYRAIDLTDNVVSMLCGKCSAQCGIGMPCHQQLVIEAQGDVYPCDFFANDKYCCGNIMQSDISQLLNSTTAMQFVTDGNTLPVNCKTCPHFHICRGHCKRLRPTIITDDICAYQQFLDYFVPYASQIAKLLCQNG